MKNNLLYCRFVVCFIFLLGIHIDGAAASDQILWYTSKDAAVEAALNEGKFILLIAGRTTCPNCQYMALTVCETTDPPIRQTIDEHYVPWFCYVDYSTEHQVYLDGIDYYTLPLICRIDPHNPDEYIDRTTNIQDIDEFYNRLLDGLDDMDSDGMPDDWEALYGLNSTVNDAADDLDEDGLTNINEYNSDTYPNDPDSDDDGMPDGWEVQYGLFPLIKDADSDADSDGWTNLEEYLKETIPNDVKSHPSRGMPWLPLLLEGE